MIWVFPLAFFLSVVCAIGIALKPTPKKLSFSRKWLDDSIAYASDVYAPEWKAKEVA